MGNQEAVEGLNDATLTAASLALKAMNKYGGGNGTIILNVLEEMKPFDSPDFTENAFWLKIEKRMKEVEELRERYNSSAPHF